MHDLLIQSLKDCKCKESTIETALARVEVYKKAIEDPNSFIQIHTDSGNSLGMIKGKGGKPSSPVEKEIQQKEKNKEETIKTLKEWINEDLSRIYPLQIEVEQIKGALNALTKQQRHIIDCKYFEKMFWRDIEISFNEEFKTYITVAQLKKKNKESLDELIKILKTYFERRLLSEKPTL